MTVGGWIIPKKKKKENTRWLKWAITAPQNTNVWTEALSRLAADDKKQMAWPWLSTEQYINKPSWDNGCCSFQLNDTLEKTKPGEAINRGTLRSAGDDIQFSRLQRVRDLCEEALAAAGGGGWRTDKLRRHLKTPDDDETKTLFAPRTWKQQSDRETPRGVFLRRTQAPGLPFCLLFCLFVYFFFLTGWQRWVPVLEEEMKKTRATTDARAQGFLTLPLCAADVVTASVLTERRQMIISPAAC